MRGKNDATTYPDKLCFNVLSTVPRENRLADFLYYIYMSKMRASERVQYLSI